MPESWEEAGAHLRSVRETHGMTHEDLAHAAGVAVATISRYENARMRRAPTKETIEKLADALTIEAAEISVPAPAEVRDGIGDRLERLQAELEAVKQEVEDLKDERGAALYLWATAFIAWIHEDVNQLGMAEAAAVALAKGDRDSLKDAIDALKQPRGRVPVPA